MSSRYTSLKHISPTDNNAVQIVLVLPEAIASSTGNVISPSDSSLRQWEHVQLSVTQMSQKQSKNGWIPTEVFPLICLSPAPQIKDRYDVVCLSR